MAKLFPSSADVEPRDETRVIGIDSEDADDLLSALSSDTARSVLAVLHDDPATPSEVAAQVDTSLQNTQYHLGRLEDAGVVEVADTVYSEKGREMKVYAPTDRALVVVAGSEEDTSGLKSALKRLLGGVGALGIASVLLDSVVRQTGADVSLQATSGGGDGGESASGGGGASGDGGAGGGVDVAATTTAEPSATPTATPTPEPTVTAATEDDGFSVAEATTTEPETATATAESTATQTATEVATADPTATQTATEVATAEPTATQTATEVATETAAATSTPTPTPVETQLAVDTVGAAGDPLLAGLSPGALFFLGGTTVLVSWFVLWYVRQ